MYWLENAGIPNKWESDEVYYLTDQPFALSHSQIDPYS